MFLDIAKVSTIEEVQALTEVELRDIVSEMSSACDLEALPDEERILALVDFLAVQHKRGTIEERRRDLEIRYGPSSFIARNARLAEELKREIEEKIGRPLYPLLQINE